MPVRVYEFESHPGLPLPVRLHECRPFRGHRGSWETTLTGLRARLSNLDLDYGPASGALTVGGSQIPFTIYCTTGGTARDTYRGDDAIVFSVNGQTHATLGQRFFRRSRVAMGLLEKDLTVVLDCSQLDTRSMEQLFLNSRDRLADSRIRREVEDQLEEALGRHPGLRALKEKRAREESERKLGESRPLADALTRIIRQNPTLLRLFVTGERLPKPFDTRVQEGEGGGPELRKHPSFFKLARVPYGEELVRECHLESRMRIAFETDAEDDYFTRPSDPGLLEVSASLNGAPAVADSVMNLYEGSGTLNVKLPAESKVGDELALRVSVEDVTRPEPFINVARVSVLEAQQGTRGPGGPRPERTGSRPETGATPPKVALPEVMRVGEDSWPEHDMNELSALRVRRMEATDSATDEAVFRFYVNVDNLYLLAEKKAKPSSARLSEERFVAGLVLLGLGMVREPVSGQSDTDAGSADDSLDVETLVAISTDGLAPMLLPAIESLGALDVDELASADENLTPELV